MDVMVTAAGNDAWTMTDLLGREMGSVKQKGDIFTIRPSGNAVKTMAALTSKSYKSLDAALAAIEEHTRGVCRRVS
jgi:hypothetical protein